MTKLYQIGNAFQTPGVLSALVRNIKKQNKFIQSNIQFKLDDARSTNDGSLDEEDFKKITHYYGLAVPAILGEAICALRGFPMSEKERLSLTYQGAMTGLFDDFFDKQGMGDQALRELMNNPREAKGKTSAEKLFLQFYNKALENAEEPGLMLHYLQKVYEAQVESRKQAAPGLNEEEVLDITLNKGGVSVLFYRAVMSHPFLRVEEEALYKMGGLMQLGNDVFDIYKDVAKGIRTPVTIAHSVKDIRKLFKKVMDESFDSIAATGYEPRHIKKFLRLVAMSLCSRCFVFFDQLERAEKETRGVFRPELYSRNQLVCDMEKPVNKRKTISYFLKQKISIAL